MQASIHMRFLDRLQILLESVSSEQWKLPFIILDESVQEGDPADPKRLPGSPQDWKTGRVLKIGDILVIEWPKDNDADGVFQWVSMPQFPTDLSLEASSLTVLTEESVQEILRRWNSLLAVE